MKPRVESAEPNISVIIPFHNASRTILRTLLALAKSELIPFEVICVDDRSTDEGRGVVKSYLIDAPFPLTLLEQQKGRRGAAAARNLGAQYAKGDYLLFLDSDVVVETNTIGNMVRSLIAQKGTAVVGLFSNYSLQASILAHFQAFLVNSIYESVDPLNSPIMGSQCLLFSKDNFQANGGFDEEYSGATVEDFDFGYKLRERGHKILIDKKALIIHNHEYNFRSFSRNYYKKAYDLTYLLFQRKNVSMKDTVYYSSNWPVIFSILAPLVSFTAISYYCFNYLIVLGLLVLGMVSCWLPFFIKVLSVFGLWTALIFIALRVYVFFLGGIGSFNALTHHVYTNLKLVKG